MRPSAFSMTSMGSAPASSRCAKSRQRPASEPTSRRSMSSGPWMVLPKRGCTATFILWRAHTCSTEPMRCSRLAHSALDRWPGRTAPGVRSGIADSTSVSAPTAESQCAWPSMWASSGPRISWWCRTAWTWPATTRRWWRLSSARAWSLRSGKKPGGPAVIAPSPTAAASESTLSEEIWRPQSRLSLTPQQAGESASLCTGRARRNPSLSGIPRLINPERLTF